MGLSTILLGLDVRGGALASPHRCKDHLGRFSWHNGPHAHRQTCFNDHTGPRLRGNPATSRGSACGASSPRARRWRARGGSAAGEAVRARVRAAGSPRAGAGGCRAIPAVRGGARGSGLPGDSGRRSPRGVAPLLAGGAGPGRPTRRTLPVGDEHRSHTRRTGGEPCALRRHPYRAPAPHGAGRSRDLPDACAQTPGEARRGAGPTSCHGVHRPLGDPGCLRQRSRQRVSHRVPSREEDRVRPPGRRAPGPAALARAAAHDGPWGRAPGRRALAVRSQRGLPGDLGPRRRRRRRATPDHDRRCDARLAQWGPGAVGGADRRR